jgi:hypothetical protein
MEALVIVAYLFVGLVLGFAAGAMLFGGQGRRSPILPPATVKQLARVARANRADLSQMRARAAGDPPPRALDHFDHEGITRP